MKTIEQQATAERIIRLDGTTSSISPEEAYLNMREVITDSESEWVIPYSKKTELVWKNNCWMERKRN